MTAIKTVLVANRGEIALRIIRGIHDQNLEAVAVYADQDLDSRYVQDADQAYSLEGSTLAQTYLAADKILDIAKRAGADAIHPGYGFLAEDPAFARAVSDAGLIWIGPDAEAIEALGDKVKARNTAKRCDVQPVPGIDTPLSDRSDAEEFIATWGYPVVIKRADGGGGRGISVLTNDKDLQQFFTGRDTESLGAFFIERFVEKARHVETQCGRDQQGNFTVYSTRDCSIQRRHQKLIEEAPAPFLAETTAEALREYSRRLFEGVNYRGLGTCEFLVDRNGDVYFLEVNPRLQVEHTVTEEVTGIDLVRQQLKIAAGENLTLAPTTRGHSFEFRITSEDPAAGLTPTTGKLTHLSWPTGPGVRIDTGVEAGDTVAADFDSMIAKVIVTAEDRPQAIQRSLRVLNEIAITGLGTPISLYQHIIANHAFEGTDGKLGIYTRWLEEEILPSFTVDAPDQAGSAECEEKIQRHDFVIEIDGRRHVLSVPTSLVSPIASAEPIRPPQPLRSQRESTKVVQSVVDDPSVISSPMQAIVVRVGVEEGQQVQEGDLVMVLESMKMEKYVHSSRTGTISQICVTSGDNVSPGQVLVRLEDSDEK